MMHGFLLAVPASSLPAVECPRSHRRPGVLSSPRKSDCERHFFRSQIPCSGFGCIDFPDRVLSCRIGARSSPNTSSDLLRGASLVLPRRITKIESLLTGRVSPAALSAGLFFGVPWLSSLHCPPLETLIPVERQ